MTLAFTVGGARAVIPAVYSTFQVAGSLVEAVPAGRAVFIFGEAEEGAPGAELDLRGMGFTDFNSVRDFYKSGPIVDAARQIFTKQPSQAFGGAVRALFIYKTNSSTRAEKLVSAPANYGSLVASRYGERGNQIRSQITTGQAESKPTKTFLYAPSPAARSFQVDLNGVLSAALPLTGGQLADSLVTQLNTVTGLTATGGTARVVNAAALDVDATASGDLLTLTKSAGAGTFGTETQVGDVAYIAPGTAIAGAGDANAGAYVVTAWSLTQVTLKQLKHAEAAGEANAEAFDTFTATTLGVGDLDVNAPVVATVTATTATGAGASLELIGLAGATFALGGLVRDEDLNDMLSSAAAAVASLSATVPSAGKLAVTLTSGSWSNTPKVGDLVRIGRGSVLEGATFKNVGLFAVEAASSQSLTLAHLYSGMTTEAVAAVAVNGQTTALRSALGFVGSTVAARTLTSAAERKVKLDAIRTTDGVMSNPALIGGNVALELSYYNVAATACTVSIDAQRVLTITPTGSGLTPITVRTGKYQTLQQLVDWLNTQSGVSARVSQPAYKSLSPSVLDMVSAVGCLQALAGSPGYNARLKKDYADWKQYFVDNFNLLAFREGTLVLKAGLPDSEATATFLSGAVLGATSSATIQSALDAGLKIDVRNVVPLFSRDAQYDVSDGLTDPDSSYTIESVNAATRAHVSTASGDLVRKRRFGLESFDGSFADAKLAASNQGYERVEMAFQRCRALDASGATQPFLPWMLQCCTAAGRSQAASGVSLLKKAINVSAVYHVGQVSLYSDVTTPDFDVDDNEPSGELAQAIEAGLMAWKADTGKGIRLATPDLTTRSAENDPQGWVYERASVLFVCDEFRETAESVMDNFIGNRTTDTPAAFLETDLKSVLRGFIGSGALLTGSIIKVEITGNIARARISITPAEALEAIILDVTAERSI